MIVSHRQITLVLSLVLVSAVLGAQDPDSVISGTITDGDGVPVGGAQVKVRHLETGRTWSQLTGSQGVYIAPSLPLGSYVIEASAARFKTALTGIYLKNPREVVLDLALQPGEDAKQQRAPTSSQAPRQGQSGRGNSSPSRVTREDASRSSGNYRLPPPSEFPPADRRSSSSPLPEPPATRQAPSSVESPPVEERASTSPSPEPPVTRQVPPTTVQTGGFSVQVAAYRQRRQADEFLVMLQDRGYTAYVVEGDIPGSGLYYRVRVGPFGTQEEVAEVVADMRNRLPEPLPDFWIIPSDR